MFFIPLVVSLTSLLCSVSCCEQNCKDKPVFTPSTLVVKHSDSTSATCSVCQACTELLDLEKAVGVHTTNRTTITWTIDKMTEWKTKALCHYFSYDNKQCCSTLFVTVYKLPDSVSFSFTHSGPILEGRQYTLQCAVQNVAPVDNLTVTFYRGQTTLAQVLPTSNPERKPVSKVFTLSINVSREDDGAQFWCEARLELGPDGPQPPPVVKSQIITAIVHYKPHVERSSHPDPIVVTEGGRLQLNCSAEGSPPPSFTWELPGLPGRLGHLLTSTTFLIDPVTVEDEGQYVCFITNNMGTVNATFNVAVKGLPSTTTATTTAATTTAATTTAATTTAATTTAATTTAATTTAATTTAATTTAATTTATTTTQTTTAELTPAPSSSTSIALARWLITWLMILISLVI